MPPVKTGGKEVTMFKLKSSLYSLLGLTRQEGQKARLDWMEIELLLKFWATFACHVEATVGNGDDAHDYALSRMGYFGRFLGDEKVKEILDEVFSGFDPLERQEVLNE
jgi:hypothetical protein